MRSSTNGEEIKKWVRSSLLIGCWEFLYSGKWFSLVDQSDLIFSIVWSVGATLDGNGRIAFDKFLRNLISGMNDAFPRPKSIKISKQTNFPDRGSIYDFLFVKTGNGSWEDWASLVEKKGLYRQKLSIRKFRVTEKKSNVPKIWYIENWIIEFFKNFWIQISRRRWDFEKWSFQMQTQFNKITSWRLFPLTISYHFYLLDQQARDRRTQLIC